MRCPTSHNAQSYGRFIEWIYDSRLRRLCYLRLIWSVRFHWNWNRNCACVKYCTHSIAYEWRRKVYADGVVCVTLHLIIMNHRYRQWMKTSVVVIVFFFFHHCVHWGRTINERNTFVLRNPRMNSLRLVSFYFFFRNFAYNQKWSRIIRSLWICYCYGGSISLVQEMIWNRSDHFTIRTPMDDWPRLLVVVESALNLGDGATAKNQHFLSTSISFSSILFILIFY